MELEFSGQIFENYWNTKFYENPSSGSRIVPCGWTDGKTAIRTDTTKLIVPSHIFANVPNNDWIQSLFEFRLNSEFFVLLFWCNSSFRKSYHTGDINFNEMYILCLSYINFVIGDFWENWFTPIQVLCKVQTRTELKFLHRMCVV